MIVLSRSRSDCKIEAERVGQNKSKRHVVKLYQCHGIHRYTVTTAIDVLCFSDLLLIDSDRLAFSLKTLI